MYVCSRNLEKKSRAWKYTIAPNQEYLYVYDQGVCDIVQYSCQNKIEVIDRSTIIPIDYSLLKVYDSMKDLGKSSHRLPRKRTKKKEQGQSSKEKDCCC